MHVNVHQLYGCKCACICIEHEKLDLRGVTISIYTCIYISHYISQFCHVPSNSSAKLQTRCSCTPSLWLWVALTSSFKPNQEQADPGIPLGKEARISSRKRIVPICFSFYTHMTSRSHDLKYFQGMVANSKSPVDRW